MIEKLRSRLFINPFNEGKRKKVENPTPQTQIKVIKENAFRKEGRKNNEE